MIEVKVHINREHTVANLKAVRVSPLGIPKDGQECKYKLVLHDKEVGTIFYPYGDGISLAIAMLEDYKKNKNMYTAIAIYKSEEEN